MNHTIYFKNENLYADFCRYAKTTRRTVSVALDEAMRLWLQEQKGWSPIFKKIKPDKNNCFRFEDARKSMIFNERDVF